MVKINLYNLQYLKTCFCPLRQLSTGIFIVSGMNRSSGVIPLKQSTEIGQGVLLYSCNMCRYQTAFQHNLNRHRDTVHQRENTTRSKTFVCDQCGKVYRSKFGLRIHIASIHQASYRFTCHVCNKGFNVMHHLRSHLACHNEKLKIKCEKCGASFRYKKELNSHNRAVHLVGGSGIRCEVAGCGIEFTMSGALHEHTLVKHQGRMFKCDVCGKPYRWRSSLGHHKYTQHKIK